MRRRPIGAEARVKSAHRFCSNFFFFLFRWRVRDGLLLVLHGSSLASCKTSDIRQGCGEEAPGLGQSRSDWQIRGKDSLR